MFERYGKISKFLLTRVGGTGISYLIYLLLLQFAHYRIAYSIAYAAGIVVAYYSGALWVFDGPITWRTALLFSATYLLQYLIGLLIIDVAVRQLGVSEQIALAVSVIVTIPLTYFFSKKVFEIKAPA